MVRALKVVAKGKMAESVRLVTVGAVEFMSRLSKFTSSLRR